MRTALTMVAIAMIGGTTGNSPAAADACGDLWMLAPAATTLCIGHATDPASNEREMALRLMTAGDWTWDRVDEDGACVIEMRFEGQLGSERHRLTHICRIAEPVAFFACVDAALQPTEAALCHLRHFGP